MNTSGIAAIIACMAASNANARRQIRNALNGNARYVITEFKNISDFEGRCQKSIRKYFKKDLKERELEFIYKGTDLDYKGLEIQEEYGKGEKEFWVWVTEEYGKTTAIFELYSSYGVPILSTIMLSRGIIETYDRKKKG